MRFLPGPFATFPQWCGEQHQGFPQRIFGSYRLSRTKQQIVIVDRLELGGFMIAATTFPAHRKQQRISMNRREFLSTGATTAIALGTNAVSAQTGSPVPLAERMKLGDQTEPTSETHLKYLARYSVRHICAYQPVV
jgi:hypothetical protein